MLSDEDVNIWPVAHPEQHKEFSTELPRVQDSRGPLVLDEAVVTQMICRGGGSLLLIPPFALLGCHVLHPLATPACSALPRNTLSFITSQFSSGSVFWLQPTGLPTAIKCLCRKSSKAFQKKELGLLRTRQQGEHRIPICLWWVWWRFDLMSPGQF